MDRRSKSVVVPNVDPHNSSSTNHFVNKINKDHRNRASISEISPDLQCRYNERRGSYLKNLVTTTPNESTNKSNADNKSKNTRMQRLLSKVKSERKVKNNERRSSYMPRNWIKKKFNAKEINTEATEPCDLFVKFEITKMQRLTFELKRSVESLQEQKVSNVYLEDWACIIFECMSAPSRTFHSVQHVFDISEGADPISKLAALFHDVIYYSIDDGLVNDRVEELIGNVFIEVCENGKKQVCITEQTLDVNTTMVMDIFGFEPGQILDPFRGMNEFLSAVVAIRCCQNILTNVHLVKIAACIEATISFRKINDQGKSPCDLLHDRLVCVNEKYRLGLNDNELVETVRRAAYLSNRDLDNFSSPRAVFLSNTWNLLPESNISLRNTKVFRISDYALALKKMTGFFDHLDPATVYLSFRDEKNKDKMALLKEKNRIAKLNIEVARKYMHCKLLSIGVVAAISELTGGDAPLALFCGDLPESNCTSISVEDFIDVPTEPIDNTISLDYSVFDLLRYGRESESDFDIKNSPLAAYLYALVGDEGVEKCLTHAVCPMDEVHAKALLRSIPKIALATIIAACAELATTRVERFDEIMDEFTV